MSENLEDICMHLECAVSQREEELKAGLGTNGTKGYELVGCYSCKGYNKDCEAYLSSKGCDSP